MDVHSFEESVDIEDCDGSEDLPAAWHCVVSHEASEMYHEVNLKPDKSCVQKICERIYYDMSIPLPYAKDSSEKVSQELSPMIK